MNSLKWAAVIFLIASGVAANYHFSDQSLLIRIIGLIIVAMLAVAIALQTDKGKRFWEFSQASRNELRKVVWPNRQETIQTTVMVLAMVAILGLILWGVDTLLLNIVARIIGYGA